MATASPSRAKDRYLAALRNQSQVGDSTPMEMSTSPVADVSGPAPLLAEAHDRANHQNRAVVSARARAPPPPPPPPPAPRYLRSGSTTRTASRHGGAASTIQKGGPPPAEKRQLAPVSRWTKQSKPSVDRLPSQLVHQKKQWDASKDIPRGTVRNSPFTPKGEPLSPQLVHQKNQWNAQRDIPRGLVSEIKNASSPDRKGFFIHSSPTIGPANKRESPKPESFRGLRRQSSKASIACSDKNQPKEAQRAASLGSYRGSSSPFEVIDPEPGRSETPNVVKPCPVHSSPPLQNTSETPSPTAQPVTPQHTGTDRTEVSCEKEKGDSDESDPSPVRLAGGTDPWIIPESTDDIFGVGKWGAVATTSGESWDDAWFVGNAASFGGGEGTENDVPTLTEPPDDDKAAIFRHTKMSNVTTHLQADSTAIKPQGGDRFMDEQWLKTSTAGGSIVMVENAKKLTREDRSTERQALRIDKEEIVLGESVRDGGTLNAGHALGETRVQSLGQHQSQVAGKNFTERERQKDASKEKKRRGGLFGLFGGKKSKPKVGPKTLRESSKRNHNISIVTSRVNVQPLKENPADSPDWPPTTISGDENGENRMMDSMALEATTVSPGSTVSDMTDPTIFSTKFSERLVSVVEVLDDKSSTGTLAARNGASTNSNATESFGTPFNNGPSPSSSGDKTKEKASDDRQSKLTDVAVNPSVEGYRASFDNDNELFSFHLTGAPSASQLSSSKSKDDFSMDVVATDLTTAGDTIVDGTFGCINLQPGGTPVRASQVAVRSPRANQVGQKTHTVLSHCVSQGQQATDAHGNLEIGRSFEPTIPPKSATPRVWNVSKGDDEASLEAPDPAIEVLSSEEEDVSDFSAGGEGAGSPRHREEEKNMDRMKELPFRIVDGQVNLKRRDYHVLQGRENSEDRNLSNNSQCRTAASETTQPEKEEKEHRLATQGECRRKPSSQMSTSAYLKRFAKKKAKSNSRTAAVDQSKKLRAAENCTIELGSSVGPSSVETDEAVVKTEPEEALTTVTTNSLSTASRGSAVVRSSFAQQAGSKESTKPRSILRKARRGAAATPSVSSNYNDVLDPMQRAGLRLLAAAVIPIQAEIRRFLAKREALNRLWAIVAIQTYSRRWLVENQIEMLVYSALAIQTAFRGWRARVAFSRDLRAFRRTMAATRIQAAFRGMVERQSYYRTLASTRIQAAFRGMVAWRSYHRTMAATRIQAAVRGMVAWRSYHRTMAATRIQAAVRGMVAWRSYHRTMAATRIQAAFRGMVAWRSYHRTMAAMRIQAAFRGMVAWRSYHRTMAAARIQAAFRGMVARRSLCQTMAAVDIQAIARGWRCRTDYKRTQAARQIQASFRGWLARDFIEDQHDCATQIQRIVRGYLATLDVYASIYKVILIQSFTRMKIAMEAATYRMAFIIQVQSIFRGHYVRKQLRNFRSRACLIQTAWRGYSARLNFQFDMLDIILIQSVYRRRKARRITQAARREKSAIIIQARWRTYDCTMNYLHYLADILIVQSAVRRLFALRTTQKTRRLLHTRKACVIQGSWRLFSSLRRQRRREAAVVIQKTWRGFVSFADFMFTVADVVIVQAKARSWIAKRETELRRRSRCNTMARKIQTKWRGYHCRQAKAKKVRSAVICQCAVRRFLAWNSYMKDLTEKYAAETIQRAWWDYLLRCDENLAAITVQTAWRRFWLFSNYIILLDSTIRIQSHARTYVVKQSMQKQCESAVHLQRSCRGFLARRQASAKSMVFAIVSSGRAVAGRDDEAAISMQRVTRGHQARYAVKLFLAARRIQAMWRRAGPREAFLTRRAAVVIQSKWRCYRLLARYIEYKAATSIQSNWRCHRVRVRYVEYKSATSIQANWRKSKDRESYRRYIAARRVQTNWRGANCRNAYAEFRKAYYAAIVVQKVWRGFLCYTDFIFTVTDIVTVQRIARGLNARRSLARLRYQRDCEIASMVVQRVYRGYRVRTSDDVVQVFKAHQERKLESATLIQCTWRGFEQKRRYWYVLGSALQVQRIIRGSVHRRRFVTYCSQRLASSTAIQTCVRGWLARSLLRKVRLQAVVDSAAQTGRGNRAAAVFIQRWYKIMAETRKKPREREAAAIKIQSFFLMVKSMVEFEIRAEKRRRKIKKMMKNRTPAIDDAILEDVWADTVETPVYRAPDAEVIRQAEIAAANELRGRHRSSFQSKIPKPSRPTKKNEKVTRSRRSEVSAGRVGRVEKKILPPPYYELGLQSLSSALERPTENVSIKCRYDDDVSEVSGLTMHSTYRMAPPPSRLGRLTGKDLADDFSLEEAWIDTEIRNVKERQHNQRAFPSTRSSAHQFQQSASTKTKSVIHGGLSDPK